MKTAHEISIEMAADVVRLTQDMQRAQSVVDRGMQGMARSADVAIKALGALGVTLSLGAIVGMVRDLGRVSNEITNMSRAAGLGVEQFQVLAFGAERFGVSQEKLADIVKDTQDKIGDFVQTGGGAMADFFENIAPRVGVTVDQFRALNGADALQLYVSSLEKANLSQADMVFYMEAIASDSTLLLPLLQDGGKALAEYGDSALRMGKILDEEAIDAARKFDDAMKDVSDSVNGAKTQMVVGLAPAMIEVAASVSALIQDLPRLTEKFGPYLAGGAVTLGLMALPGLITAISATILTRLLPALIAIGPYLAAFAAVAGTIGFVINRIQDANSRLATVEKAQAQVEILQKQIAAAEKLMESGQGSIVTVKRLEAMRRELGIATKTVDDFRAANEKIPAVVSNVGGSYSAVTKTAKQLAAEAKLNRQEAEKLTKQIDLLAKALNEAEMASRKNIADRYESATSIREQASQLREQAVVYGANEKELRRLELAKIDDQIATVQQASARAMLDGGNAQLLAAYQDEINALRDLKAAKMGLFDAQAQEENKKAMEQLAIQSAQEFDRIFDDMSRALTDALFEGGKSGGELLKNYFKTFAIKVFVEPEIKAALGGLFGVGGAGGQAAGLSSLFGNVGSSFFQNSLLGGFSGAFGSAAGYAATVPGLTSAAAGSQAAMLAAQTGSFGAAGTAATAAAGGSAAAGFASSALAAAPYIAAAALIVGALRKKKDPLISLGNARFGFEGGQIVSETANGAAITDTVRSGAQQIADTYRSLVESLGGKAIEDFNIAFGAFTSKGTGTKFGFDVAAGGNTLLGQAETALTDENIQFANLRASFALLNFTELADNVKDVVASVDLANPSLEQLTRALSDAQLLAAINNLTELGGVMATLSGASIETVESLLALTGGIEGLAQGQTAFYAAFTTEEQKRADLTKQVTQALSQFNVTIPSTRQGLFDLVNGLDLQDETQRKLFTTILELTPALDQLIPAFEQASQFAQQAAQMQQAQQIQAIALQQSVVDVISSQISTLQQALVQARKDSIQSFQDIHDKYMRLSKEILGVRDEFLTGVFGSQGATEQSTLSSLQEAVERLRGGDETAMPLVENLTRQYQEQIQATSKDFVDLARNAANLSSVLSGSSNDLTAQAQRAAVAALNVDRRAEFAQGTLKSLIAPELDKEREKIESRYRQQFTGLNGFSEERIMAMVEQALKAREFTLARKFKPNLAEEEFGFGQSDIIFSQLADFLAFEQKTKETIEDLKKQRALEQAKLDAQKSSIPQFSTGGFVSGPGTNTSDSIPAYLSNGEFVMRASAVDRIGVSNLNMMNQGGMPNSNSALVAEIRALRAEVAQLRQTNSAENQGIAVAVTKTAQVLVKVTENGDSVFTEERV